MKRAPNRPSSHLNCHSASTYTHAQQKLYCKSTQYRRSCCARGQLIAKPWLQQCISVSSPHNQVKYLVAASSDTTIGMLQEKNITALGALQKHVGKQLLDAMTLEVCAANINASGAPRLSTGKNRVTLRPQNVVWCTHDSTRPAANESSLGLPVNYRKLVNNNRSMSSTCRLHAMGIWQVHSI